MVFNSVSTVFQLYRCGQCTYPCFPEILLTSTPHIILSKPLAAFLHNHCRNNRQRWGGMTPEKSTSDDIVIRNTCINMIFHFILSCHKNKWIQMNKQTYGQTDEKHKTLLLRLQHGKKMFANKDQECLVMVDISLTCITLPYWTSLPSSFWFSFSFCFFSCSAACWKYTTLSHNNKIIWWVKAILS